MIEVKRCTIIFLYEIGKFIICLIGDIMFSYLITFLAGCSTLIGFLFVYIKDHSNKVLISSLAFASGVMFLISVSDLIPESFLSISKTYYIVPSILIVSMFVVIGIILSMMIDKYLPNNSYQENKLYRVGMISMLAIMFHNIPEGIATFLTSNHDLKLGITLAIALALHNIPEGISVAIPIYYSTGSKIRSFLYTFISGMSEFLGAIIASIFLVGFSNDFFMGCLYAIIAGIMMHISIYELLPSSFNYKKPKVTFVFFIIGILFMYISSLILH